MTTCIFLRSCAQPEAAFASVAELASHVHALRDGRPVVLKRCVVTVPEDSGRQAVAVHIAGGDETLGYAIVGDPPLNSGAQYDRLGAALAALHREAA